MSEIAHIARHAAQMGYGIQAWLAAADVQDLMSLAEPFDHVWLVCSVGDTVQRRWLGHRDPELLALATARHERGGLDEHCRRELREMLGTLPHEFLFPESRHQTRAPLVALLGRAGLLRPSPIMSSLHRRYGSWWAVRAALAVGCETPPIRNTGLGPDPCIDCPAPCIDACPADAVARAGWDWHACAEHRVREHSACADRCFARSACPIGTEHRYSEPVARYHYLASLPSVRRWRTG